MKPNQHKPSGKSRVRVPIVLTSIPTLILTTILIIKFPEFIDRMHRVIENTELNGTLNESGTTSTFEAFVLFVAFVLTITLWVHLIRRVNSYKRQYLRSDQRLIDSKQYSKLFKIWMSE
jgi:multisubunit Na+/H+ antiporter MnhG subunit